MKSLLAFALAMLAGAMPAPAAPHTVRLAVPGMNCSSCPITVKKALSRVKGVAKVEVSLEKREAVVTFDDATTDVATLIAATTNAGYPSTVK